MRKRRRAFNGILLESVLQDIRFAFRIIFFKSRATTLIALLILGLGIGANSAFFSIVKGVLLSPLRFQDSDRLVQVWESMHSRGLPEVTVTMAHFDEWRKRARSFQEMASLSPRNYFHLIRQGEPLRVRAAFASPALLSLLGVSPLSGRIFGSDEEKPGADPVCMLGESFWRSLLAGDPKWVGRSLALSPVGVWHPVDWQACTVVGILPRGMDLLTNGSVDVWLPLIIDPTSRGYPMIRGFVFAKLRRGVSNQQASQEISSISEQLDQEDSRNVGLSGHTRPLLEEIVQDHRTNLLILYAAVGIVLLIACVNVAGLLAAQSVSRRREIALRGALGCQPSRLVRQLLTESLILALAGGLLGLALAYAGIQALASWGLDSMPRLSEVTLDATVLAFTFGLSLITGTLFGLLPAFQTLRGDLDQSLKEGLRSVAPRGSHGMRSVFVALQMALALILLIGAGLLLKSFTFLHAIDPGFDSEGRIVMRIDLPTNNYPDAQRALDFHYRLIERIRALPGVKTVGAGTSVPRSDTLGGDYLTIEKRPAKTTQELRLVTWSNILPGYLETLGIKIVAGRGIRPGDGGEAPAALINQALVDAFYPNQDPIGSRIQIGMPEHLLPPGAPPTRPWHTIVGVVADVRQQGHSGMKNFAATLGPQEEVQPQIYTPAEYPGYYHPSLFFVAHILSTPKNIAQSFRQAVRDVDPQQPVTSLHHLDDLFSETVARPRLNLTLIGAFGLTALLLSLVGVYGSVSHTVRHRIQEIGLRMALGATRKDILGLVLALGFRLTIYGVLLGLGGALALTRWMESLLHGVSAADAGVFISVAAGLCAVALAASFLPARRAMQLQPNQVLRCE